MTDQQAHAAAILLAWLLTVGGFIAICIVSCQPAPAAVAWWEDQP